MDIINERQIKGIWVPIEIWEAKNLSWNEKILLVEIDSFTRQDIDCYISDERISEMLGVTTRQARRYMNNLIQSGYIIKTRFDGRKRYVRSAICYTDVLSDRTKMSGQIGHECPNNNINYNINIKKEYKERKDKTVADKRKEFGESLIPFKDKYPRQMLVAFMNYWCEVDDDKNPKYLKWELAKKKGGTFSISGRLATWARNNGVVKNSPQESGAISKESSKSVWDAMGITKEEYEQLNKHSNE